MEETNKDTNGAIAAKFCLCVSDEQCSSTLRSGHFGKSSRFLSAADEPEQGGGRGWRRNRSLGVDRKTWRVFTLVARGGEGVHLRKHRLPRAHGNRSPPSVCFSSTCSKGWREIRGDSTGIGWTDKTHKPITHWDDCRINQRMSPKQLIAGQTRGIWRTAGSMRLIDILPRATK